MAIIERRKLVISRLPQSRGSGYSSRCNEPGCRFWRLFGTFEGALNTMSEHLLNEHGVKVFEWDGEL